MKDNIVLIGMPGVGKSTVGVVLAKALGYNFVDADLVIQQQTGKLLCELIAEHGTEGFLKFFTAYGSEPFLGIEPYGEGSPEGAGRRKECRTDRNASWRRSLPDEGRGYCCLQGYWGEWSFSCETGGWNPHTLQCGKAGNL